MANYSSVLILIALCVGSALSLRCYTCKSQKTNTNCMTATNCSSSSSSCMTSVVGGGLGSLSGATIDKSCTDTCTETGMNIVIFNSGVSCCYTDLCNVSGASSVKSTYTILAGVLGLLGVLLKENL
ncbi:lymphocyte antigen 6E-like [Hyperolius riggenbachi]|uniref:lymphocyte antigen 6E-like n=1 Tax=Hyperolius riggenbachi TaxID=752182 RepID=UPI0035A2A958